MAQKTTSAKPAKTAPPAPTKKPAAKKAAVAPAAATPPPSGATPPAAAVATPTTTTATVATPTAPAAPAKDAADLAGIIEEATLNWTDLTGAKTGASTLGSNKFYKARLTEGGGQFVVTFTYGRVGQTGQVSIERAATLEDARKIFKSKIQSKINKGYRPLEMRSEKDELAKAAAKGVAVERPKPAVSTREFHPQIEKLLEIV